MLKKKSWIFSTTKHPKIGNEWKKLKETLWYLSTIGGSWFYLLKVWYSSSYIWKKDQTIVTWIDMAWRWIDPRTSILNTLAKYISQASLTLKKMFQDKQRLKTYDWIHFLNYLPCSLSNFSNLFFIGQRIWKKFKETKLKDT